MPGPLRGAPRIAPLLLVLLVAGCAGRGRSAPAPVDERPVGGAAAPAPAEAPATATPAPAGPVIQPLEEQPLEAQPLPGQGEGGGAADEPPVNPAIVALLNSAGQELRAGRYEQAAAALERALRIEPANAWLWHRLARIRLEQGELEQAASLAARSNSLAGGDPRLGADNWRLIATVRERQGRGDEARAARARAARLAAPGG